MIIRDSKFNLDVVCLQYISILHEINSFRYSKDYVYTKVTQKKSDKTKMPLFNWNLVQYVPS